MADIFISYAKKDREKVEPIALALKEQGWSVFWDRAIPGGKTWDEVIEEELDAAKCVVVVWSKISIKSRWVRAEAEEGLHRNILVPVSIEDVKIPLLFRPIQSVRLIHWEGDSNHPQFVKLIFDLSPNLGPSPLKIKEAEKKRLEVERKRKQEEERKAAEEKRRKEQELKQKAEEERQKEAEAKRKEEEERKRSEVKAEIKPEMPEPPKPKPGMKKPAEKSPTTKIGILIALFLVIVVGAILLFRQEPTKSRTEISSPPVKQEQQVETKPSEASSLKEFTNTIGMEFVLIPAGSFTMGSNAGDEDEKPPHEVKILQTFYLQTTEVSQGQWEKVMGNNPSYFKNCGEDCPVEQVSWDDAQKFISKLNQMEDTNKYRLPTEAEWEYACRAGTETAYSFGDEVAKLGEYGWYADNSESQTHPGGKKKPNAWGLNDMHGNVWEWVQDWLGEYPSNSVVDPKGPDKGEYRVLRGGSWYLNARNLRSAYRGRSLPDHRNYHFGFRVARDF